MYNKIKLKILRKILLKAKTNHNNKTALKQIRNIKIKKFKIRVKYSLILQEIRLQTAV